MTKNILLTTDFSLESLQILKGLLNEYQFNNQTNYNIHLVIGYDRGDSIRDLLFDNHTKIISKLKTNEFDEACAILRNKFSNQINDIQCHIFSGYFQNSFDQFVESKKIDQIYFSKRKPKHIDKNVFDIMRFIKKCKIEKIEVSHENQSISHERGKLAAFFT